jgi:hypothetical protein
VDIGAHQTRPLDDHGDETCRDDTSSWRHPDRVDVCAVSVELLVQRTKDTTRVLGSNPGARTTKALSDDLGQGL